MTARNLLFSVLCLGANFAAYAHPPETTNPMKFVQISAKDRDQRSDIANHGVSIEFVRSDSVWGFANESMMNALKKDGFKILGQFEESVGRGGHEGILDFPRKDDLYHNYAETLSALQALEAANPEYVKLSSIGKSTEGRDLWAVHLNSDQIDRDRGNSNKPGAIFMGNHHAREHLSVEVPLMFAEYLLKNKTDPRIKRYLDSLDIWIIPMVNPDGAEFDIATGRYQTWRKNRSVNFDGTYGTDLNRNYGYQWGTGGSSKDTNSEVYMGKAPFSEPETQAIRDFVSSHLNSKVLLTFHTYSELILYPWGYSKDSVNQVNPRYFKVFETMAQKMATWNHYEPMQASDLYIASGDTTDWAYGTHGIFAFTFELSPGNGMFGGGFYPGAKMIQKAFNDNIEPCLYLLENAADPYQVLGQKSLFETGFAVPRASVNPIPVIQ